MTWDITTASDKWLIDLCQAEKEEGMIRGEVYGDRVIKISQQIAVKCGYGVTVFEAATQGFAYRKADPRVYRFIESNESSPPKGYLSWNTSPAGSS